MSPEFDSNHSIHQYQSHAHQNADLSLSATYPALNLCTSTKYLTRFAKCCNFMQALTFLPDSQPVRV